MMTKTIIPEQVNYWVRQIKDPKTPIELRRNYQRYLEDLRAHIDTELGLFERSIPRPRERSRIRSMRT